MRAEAAGVVARLAREDDIPFILDLFVQNYENDYPYETFRQDEWLKPNRAEIEFYDLKTDPQGIHNVAGERARTGEITAMRKQMDTWIQTSGDKGADGDPSTEPPLADIQKSKRADYQRTWKARLQKPEPTDAERVAWWEKSYGLPSKEPIP